MKINYDPVSNYKVEWAHVRGGSGERCVTNVRGKGRFNKIFFFWGRFEINISVSRGLSLYETANQWKCMFHAFSPPCLLAPLPYLPTLTAPVFIKVKET